MHPGHGSGDLLAPVASPHVALRQGDLPLFVRWLRFVPASILSALVVPSILLDPAGDLSLIRPEFLVALPTLAFAWWTRSLGGTVVVGMVLFSCVGKLM